MQLSQHEKLYHGPRLRSFRKSLRPLLMKLEQLFTEQQQQQQQQRQSRAKKLKPGSTAGANAAILQVRVEENEAAEEEDEKRSIQILEDEPLKLASEAVEALAKAPIDSLRYD